MSAPRRGRSRPVGGCAVSVANKDLNWSTDRAWEIIAFKNDPPTLFKYGGTLVALEVSGSHQASKPLTHAKLRYYAAKWIEWYRPGKVDDEEKRGRIEAHPDDKVIANMLEAPNSPLPSLARIVSVPVIDSTGKLVSTPGYDVSSGIYLIYDEGLAGQRFPTSPSDEQVAFAKQLLLDDLLVDFPFAEQADRANAVAMMIEPYVRDLIGGPTPLHLIEKPSPGSGAGLLVDCLSIPLAGHRAAMMPEASNDEEWRKRITSTLKSSPVVICIDNLTRKLDSGALAAALTSELWQDRELGASRNVALPVSCTWIATGNNPEVSDEIDRRCSYIRIDPRHENPAERTGFKNPDLRAWLRMNRWQVVNAVLTLVLYWTRKGQPRSARAMGSFAEWAGVMGGILDTCGIEGFQGNRSRQRSTTNTERQILERAVRSWHDQYGVNSVTAEMLVAVPDCLALANPTATDTVISFGKALVKYRDRIVGGFKITSLSRSGGKNHWALVPADRRTPS